MIFVPNQMPDEILSLKMQSRFGIMEVRKALETVADLRDVGAGIAANVLEQEVEIFVNDWKLRRSRENGLTGT